MFNIDKRIIELRKEFGLSQADLAKKLNASRDMIGKYERNEHLPSIEMASKIADLFGVTIDYLLGKETLAKYNKKSVKRLENIERLDSETKNILFRIIDTFIRDYKTQQAYK